jgi:hypothetical protein
MTWAGESAQSGVYIFTQDGSPESVAGNLNDVLIYGSAGKPAFVSYGINNLADVDTVTNPPSLESSLVWNGTNFIPSGLLGNLNSSTDNAVVRFDGTGGKRIQNSEIIITDSGNITNPRLVVFREEFNNGNSGTSIAINWNEGQKQTVTLNNNTTFTFVHPVGASNLLLRLVQDSTGGRTVIWPTGVLFTMGQSSPLTTTANAVDIVTFYYNNFRYYGVISFSFT